ncbi:MAG: trypsin-like peptidase domain-containing protein [Gammaproteobacteria bacterium]|nr:trypsin-like peptidase domain-containing protein [Gammaproteobacteria bacterium]
MPASPNILAFLFKCLLLALVLYASPSQAVETKTIFSQYKDRLLQIRIIDTTTNSQSTIGSGFFVDSFGTIVTNYHVISKHIFAPQQYRIEYVMNDASVHPAVLINIDVIHDLAVLDGKRIASPHLELMGNEISKGERIYTLGNPLDLGMTIVESTYNGLTDDTMHERILLSGALNPGMSGGPSLTDDGLVVGINVAATGNNIGFLVPVHYLKKLLTTRVDPDIKNLLELVRAQLLANQNDYIHNLLAKPLATKLLGDYTVPDKIAPYLNCWGDSEQENKPYRGSTNFCAIKNDIFLNNHFSTGEIRYSHHHLSGENMNSLRFYSVMQQYFSNPSLSLSGDKEDVGEFNCQSDFVTHKSMHMKVAFCLREYQDFPGIYDMVLTAATLTEPKQGIVTTLVLGGVSYDNAVAFGKAYLGTLAWNRP